MVNEHAVLTAGEMGEMDRRAIASGVSGLSLMEAAGKAVADAAAEMVPPGARVLVACGTGNNGGDGYVAARLLQERGFDVSVRALVAADQLTGDAADAASRWHGGVDVLDDTELVGCFDLVIDAVFGAGLSRPFDSDTVRKLKAVLFATRADGREAQRLAVDVPSGLDASTGQVPSYCAAADRTVTFFRKKVGHLLLPGRALCGQVAVSDIGIPESVLGGDWPTVETSPPRSTFVLPASEPSDVHKYQRGHVMVLSGPAHATGAARLAADAALRGGAGLVTVAAKGDAVAANAAHLTAVMIAPIEDAGGFASAIAGRRATVAVVGPAAGVTPMTREAVLAAIAAGCRVVVDADAVTAFKDDPDALFQALRSGGGRPGAVLTPHAGEFRRLFPDLVGNKLEMAREAAARSGGVVVLKGPDTVIASPDGRAAINANAPSTLATAGSGDVLCGLIAAGLARADLGTWEAACHGVWLHGECAARFGAGLIAEDLSSMLPDVFDTLLNESDV